MDLVAELSLPAGIKIREPEFRLGICDDPQFHPVKTEVGELSKLDDEADLRCPP